MPKIKTHHFKATNKAGQEIEFDSDVSVDNNGVFAVVIPDLYQIDIEANLLKGCALRRPRKYFRVESKSLDDAVESVYEGLKSLLNTKETHELVIRYKYVTECHYAKHVENGKLYSNCGLGMAENGQTTDFGGRIVNWVENGAERNRMSFNSPEPYTISIQAQVLRKTTYASKSNQRVEYFRTHQSYDGTINGEKSELGEFGTKLNGFNNTNLSQVDEEIPYTEDAAKFFHDAMLAICGISDKLSMFFADKENVIMAIENQTTMLPLHQE